DVTIKSTWGMPKIPETFDLPPAVLVILEDDRPGQINDTSQKVEQVWLCLVVVNDPGNEAGPLIAQVIRAMNGWTPDGASFTPFKRVKSSFAPDTSPNGVYYFPLAFSTSFVFNT
ncbi:MAG: hypothetical protein HQM01_15445, partial [Magnetococcales bacterium]|nr:hypothetical protein [Magnetococcales bacterium]